jgi:hypothetical protein
VMVRTTRIAGTRERVQRRAAAQALVWAVEVALGRLSVAGQVTAQSDQIVASSGRPRRHR